MFGLCNLSNSFSYDGNRKILGVIEMDVNVPDTVFIDIATRLRETLGRIIIDDAMADIVPIKRHGAELICRDFGPVTVLHIIEDEDAEEPTVRLEDIILAEGSRGKGLGTSIIETLIEVCRSRRVNLNLSANPMVDYGTPERAAAEERLISWYEKLGFGNENCQRDGNMIIRNISPAPRDPEL